MLTPLPKAPAGATFFSAEGVPFLMYIGISFCPLPFHFFIAIDV
jgi:hypothetical protein